jgi:hypothetical protein
LAVEDLFFKKGGGQTMERLHVFLEDIFCFFMALGDDRADLIVDQTGRIFTIIPMLSELSSQKDLFFFLTKGKGTQFFTHSPVADHFPCDFCRMLDIVTRPGRLLIQYQFLGRPSSHHDGDVVDKVVPRIGMFFINRKLLGETEGPASWDDGHLMDGVGTRKHPRDQRMAGLVVGGDPPLFQRNDHRFPLHPHENLVFGLFKIGHVDAVFS